jgi:hypothetical protein
MMTGQSEILKGVREGFASLQTRATEQAEAVVGRVRPAAARAREVTGEYRQTVDGLAKKARETGRGQVGALAGTLRKMADRLDGLVKDETN